VAWRRIRTTSARGRSKTRNLTIIDKGTLSRWLENKMERGVGRETLLPLRHELGAEHTRRLASVLDSTQRTRSKEQVHGW